MALLILCILCNVLLAVIFKYFARYEVDNLNAIIVNYVVCVIVATLFIGESAIPSDFLSRPWVGYAVVLGFCFITGFNILALSFQKSGVALTAIIQKMSMILPAAFAIAFFNESLGLMKGMGIALGLVAIVLVQLPSRKKDAIKLSSDILMYPLLAFLFSGIIEILLFYVEAAQLLQGDGIMFTSTSFGMAAFLGVWLSSYRMIRGQSKPGVKDLIGGIILGIPNFLTIYLLIFLLTKGWDGSVLFPMNNIGILLLTVLVGVIFYRERMNRLKWIGVAAGALAILLVGLEA